VASLHPIDIVAKLATYKAEVFAANAVPVNLLLTHDRLPFVLAQVAQ